VPSLYLETAIPGYLAAPLSRDLIIAAHQQITNEWWRVARRRFDLYISEAVLDEIRAGDPSAIAGRLDVVHGLPVLQLNDDVRTLVHEYDLRPGLVGRARADLPHFAFAVAYQMDYLLRWHCSHIANGEIIRRLMQANAALNRITPLIVTPEEILEIPGGE
jgi:hypothetical protein